MPAGCSTGRWSTEEHNKFIEALQKFGKNWKKIQEHVGTRTTTQARSHAQKYFYKVDRSKDYVSKDHSLQELHKDLSAGISSSRVIIPNPLRIPEFVSEVSALESPKSEEVPQPNRRKRKAALKQYKPGRTHIAIMPAGAGFMQSRKREKPELEEAALQKRAEFAERTENVERAARVAVQRIERSANMSGSEEELLNKGPPEWDMKFDNFEDEPAKPLDLTERKKSEAFPIAATSEEAGKKHVLLDLSCDAILNPNNKTEI